MNFVHLHGHSTFSFLDGYGTPDQIAERICELGHHACAVTDHGNVFAHVPYQKAFRKAQLVPIFGCEFYVVDDMGERTKVQESLGANAYPHVTVLARNRVGYENLLRLSRLSYEEGFYYKPRVDWDTIARHSEGLIVLSGCVGGYPSRLLLNKGLDEAAAFLKHRREQIEHYYVEMIPEPDLPEANSTMWKLAYLAAQLQIPCVMTADAHFPRREDHQVQDLLVAVGIHKKLDDPDRELRLPEYQYYCSAEELLQRAKDSAWDPIADAAWEVAAAQQAIENTAYIASLCEVEIPRASGVVYPGLNGELSCDVLWKWIGEGAAKRKAQGLLPLAQEPAYIERARYEFDVIKRKGFCDYLLAIADVVNWVKHNGSVVVCRGSAGGSILLWLLGASETDPIRHGLSFERFYDDNRPDPPDVDMDFERGQRESAIQYVYQKYGRENCSQIAALSKVGAKAALQDAAFAYGIHRSEFAALSNALDSADKDVEAQLSHVTEPMALAVLQRRPELRIIDRMVGQYRQQSIHAAGVLISPDPLDKIIGVVLGKDKQPVAAVDKYGAAELGFLKMDFLAVNALDILSAALKKIDKDPEWLYTLPLDDQASLRTAERGLLAGVFQLDGAAAARVAKEIGIDSFTDVVAASALCRPGPGDWVGTYKEHKGAPAKFAAYLAQLAPQAAAIVQETYGILLYQEQVMRLARELAGFSWPDVHKLRKGVVDKVGLDPQKGDAWRAEWAGKFIGGCLHHSVSQDEAEFWWKSIQSHGGYSFNKSHCTTYGLVGYWMLYLKTHFPAAFYEAYLQHESDDLVVKRLIREFQQLGGQVKLLHPKHSGLKFSSPREGMIIGGWTNLAGIGEKTAEKILAGGPYEDWADALPVLPNAIKLKLEKAGLFSIPNTQELIQLAPWLPPMNLGNQELTVKCAYHVAGLELLEAGIQIGGDVQVCGYVTATKFDRDRVIFVLEDPTNMITCRVPLKMVKDVGPKFRELKTSDFVTVSGWWTGDVLYVKDVVVMVKYDGGRKASKAKPSHQNSTD